MSPFVGPFFYYNGEIIAHKVNITDADMRFGKLDNPYSHEKLFDEKIKVGDYIDIPRGRVVWDIEKEMAIIYIDICIEKIPGSLGKIAKVFGLENYLVKHDVHYVCPKCMGNIWE